MKEDFAVPVTLPKEAAWPRTAASLVTRGTQTDMVIINPRNQSVDRKGNDQRSIVMPHRFCRAIARQSFLPRIQRRFAVRVWTDSIKQKLHIRGNEKNAKACFLYVRGLIAGWERRKNETLGAT